MKRLKGDETLDRLSELPESVLLKILSFLKTRGAVRTTFLSKRWKDLWTTIPSLNFDETTKNSVETRNFINGVLRHWKGTQILKFKIRFGEVYDASLSADMDYWVGFATERKVEKLDLRLPYDQKKSPLESSPAYLPPHCLYSCSSLKTLCLIGYNLEICGDLQWYQLKKLKIYGYCMSEEMINQVVSSTPKLERLSVRIFGRRQNLSIQSSSLKRLNLVKYLPSVVTYDPSNYASLTIWAPNLESLYLAGAAYSECLVMDVSSLARVFLEFFDTCDVPMGETLKQIFPAIQHVKALTLSPWCFKMLGIIKGNLSLAPFSNLKLLKLIGGPIESNDIVNLLELFPKVKKLVIYWRVYKGYPLFLERLSSKHDVGVGEQYYLESEAKSLLMKLRTVKVTWYSYEAASIFEVIKTLLKHCTMIKKVVQKVVIEEGGKGSAPKSKALVLAAQQLLSLQGHFPAVDLVFLQKTID